MSDYTALGFEIDPAKMSKNAVNGIRIALGVSAVVAIVLGIMILVWPKATVALVAFLFGLYFLIIGIVRLAKGVFSRGMPGSSRTLNIILGLLLVISGIFAMRYQEKTAVLLGVILAVAWIIEGVSSLVEASRNDRSRWVGIVFGIVSIIAGVTVLFLPLQTLVVLTVVGGIFLVIGGVIQLAQAFLFGRGNGGGPAGGAETIVIA